jgi:hypothetical protein
LQIIYISDLEVASPLFSLFLLEERAVERSKTPEERMFGQEEIQYGETCAGKGKGFLE